MNFRIIIIQTALNLLVSFLKDDKRKNSRVTAFLRSEEFQNTWRDATVLIAEALDELDEDV